MGTINLQIPQAGSPNATEDPKIASDFTVLQNLLNGNLDTNNLSANANIALTQLAVALQSALFSPGDLKPSAVTVAPTGWLLCDGSQQSRSTYAALFAVCGTKFGAGDGSSTFNLPDFRGRVPVGAGTGPGLTARAIGPGTGEENHPLTSGESGMPAHGHTLNWSDPGHYHTPPNGGYPYFITSSTPVSNPKLAPSGSTNVVAASAFNADSSTSSNGTSISASVANAAAANASAGHNTMQPFTVVSWLIKT